MVLARAHIGEGLLHKLFLTSVNVVVADGPGVEQIVAVGASGLILPLVQLHAHVASLAGLAYHPSVGGSRLERWVLDEVGDVANIHAFALEVELEVVEA